MESFIIGGKRYTPDNALVLCSQQGPLDTTTLFRSTKGTFFSVTTNGIDGTQTARLMDKAQAMEFMDANPFNVIVENYSKVFGKPKEG